MISFVFIIHWLLFEEKNLGLIDISASQEQSIKQAKRKKAM